MIAATQHTRTREISNMDIFDKYLKDLPTQDKKEIVFILINSITDASETPTPKTKQENTDVAMPQGNKFRGKNGYEYRELSPKLQWLNDHPITLSEETQKDERTRYILSKCSK